MRKEDYTLENGVLTIHDGVTEIGEGAFVVNNLTSVTIPSSVAEIGGWAFRGNKITSVAIPDSVTKIGEGAFYNNQLVSVTIPNGVTEIGVDAFACNRLADVTIPDSVTKISGRAFRNNSLVSVTIPKRVTKIDVCAFASNRLADVTIPDSVTKISGWAFRNNSLVSVTIPNSVTEIGDWAFSNNTSLNKIKFMTLDGCTEYDCLCADGILAFIKNKRSFNGCTVYRAQIFKGMKDGVLKLKDCYICEKDGVFAHGRTREAAKADLLFKLAKNRGAEQYRNVTLETPMPLEDATTMYRVITGACLLGTEQFIKGLGDKAKGTYTPAEIIALTDGQYGNEVFAEYFGVVRDRG